MTEQEFEHEKEHLLNAIEDPHLRSFFAGEKTLAEAQGFDPQALQHIVQMGHAFFEQGKLDEAEQIFKGLFALHPIEGHFSMALGLIAQQRQQYQEAKEWYTRAVMQDETEPHFHAYLGEALIALGQIEAGKDSFEKALSLSNSSSHDPVLHRCRLLYEGLLAQIKTQTEAPQTP